MNSDETLDEDMQNLVKILQILFVRIPLWSHMDPAH